MQNMLVGPLLWKLQPNQKVEIEVRVKKGLEAVKEGLEAAIEGLEAATEGLEAVKEGLEAVKEGLEAVKEGLEEKILVLVKNLQGVMEKIKIVGEVNDKLYINF